MFSRLILICAEPPGLTSSATPRNAEAVLAELIAVALDREMDPLIHQARLIERDQAGRVGDVRDAAGRRQLDQRHAAAGLLIDDFDREGLSDGGDRQHETARHGGKCRRVQ